MLWRAYELRPEPVPTLDPDGEYLHRVWGAAVYPLAERLGMTLRLPPVQPRSRLAHEAGYWAREHGRFDDWNAAVFRAFFERGEDIGQPAVLSALATTLGLDGRVLIDVLAQQRHLAAVLDDERLAQRLGVSGVPAFIANRRVAASGVQSIDALEQLVARARAMT